MILNIILDIEAIPDEYKSGPAGLSKLTEGPEIRDVLAQKYRAARSCLRSVMEDVQLLGARLCRMDAEPAKLYLDAYGISNDFSKSDEDNPVRLSRIAKLLSDVSKAKSAKSMPGIQPLLALCRADMVLCIREYQECKALEAAVGKAGDD